MKFGYYSLLHNIVNWDKFGGHRSKGQGQTAKNRKIEGFPMKINK